MELKTCKFYINVFFCFITGVKFIYESNIARFIPKDDGKTLAQVELLDGTVMQADIAIVGIGSTFCTEWLKDSALMLTDNGSVIVDRVDINFPTWLLNIIPIVPNSVLNLHCLINKELRVIKKKYCFLTVICNKSEEHANWNSHMASSSI